MTDDDRQTGAAGSASTGAAGDGEAPKDAELAKRRLKGFGTHLIAYFLVMVTVVPVNYWLAPTEPWFVLPMVGWGSVLALHAAWAMGLFGIFRDGAR